MGDAPTKEEARAGYEAAMAVALAITKSRARAVEIVQDAFERVMTTRPWSRGKMPFERHVAGAVRSMLNIEHHSARKENEAEAHEGFHQEVVGYSAASPQDEMLERAEEEGKQTDADRELDELAASLANNEVAVRVLECRRASDGPLKARDIADELKVPVEQVYRANETIREHLVALRRKKGGGK